jgi:hypothetical protein
MSRRSRNKEAGREAAIWVGVMVAALVGFGLIILLADLIFSH